MKINRLLGIVTYLLNREVVSGKDLAIKFEVSERTIQRDVEYISLAGIPIVSIRGSQGGYRILDTYKFGKQTSNENDLASIELALESLASSLKDKSIESTLEKIKSINQSKVNRGLDINFEMIGENFEIQQCIAKIREAIDNDNSVRFKYINSKGEESYKIVEPLSLNFRWYTWYLVGYDLAKESYRMYKVSRMSNIREDNSITIKHNKEVYNFDYLICKDNRTATEIYFECNKTGLPYIKEYLPNHKVIRKELEFDLIKIAIFEDELYWFSILLGLGEEVKITKPPEIVEKFKSHISAIQNKYL